MLSLHVWILFSSSFEKKNPWIFNFFFYVQRQCFDGRRGVEVLAQGSMGQVEGMALDYTSKNLYIVDGQKKTITLMKLHKQYNLYPIPTALKTLIDGKVLDKPRGVAVHPAKG